MGSEKGTPISTTSQAAWTAARFSRNWRRLGNPAVRNPTSAVRPSAVAVLIAADMVSRGRMLQPRLPVVEHRALQDAHVLVASPRTADEDSRPGMRLCVAACAEDGMGSFYRRQNAFEPGAFAERIERLVISRRFVGDSPALHEKRVLWSDTRIVE